MNAKTSGPRAVMELIESRIYQHGGSSHDPGDFYPVGSIRVPWTVEPKSASTPTPTPTPALPATELPSEAVAGSVRINVGGSEFTDSHGRVWSADTFFAGGTASDVSYRIANTVNEPLYVARRFGDFTYAIAMPDGTHEVTLLFADPVKAAAGERVFDVLAEGAVKLDDFDVVEEAGPATAISRTFRVNVTDGTLNLAFDSAIVSGIQVVPGPLDPTPTPTPTPTPVPSNFTWKTAASTAKKRAEGVSWVADGKLFTTGGFESNALAVSRDVNVYDPQTNKWSLAAPTPDTMTHAAAAVDGDTVWVGTFFLRDGVSSSRRIWKYDVSDNKWSEGPQLPQARGAGGMAVVGRELHAFGGLDINQKGRTEHWRLNLDDPNAQWVADTPLPTDNNHFGAVTLNGKIYVVGGLHDKIENTANRSTVRTYDPATRKWGLAAALPLPLAHIGPTTFTAGNSIIVAGGQTNDPNDREVHTRRVLQYDLTADKWRDLPQLPAARKSSNSGFVNGRIIVANGNVLGSASVTDTVWISSLP